jgi:transposase
MRIIGCDLHARQQTISMLDTESGEVIEKTLQHEGEEVREFYAALSKPVLVGLEATGSMFWFLRLLEELGIEYRVGHPAAIRKAETRKQKHDRRDAELIRRLLVENRFPQIWLPTAEQRDLRTLLQHRHQLVRMRVMTQNGLQGLALSQGLRRGAKLWSQAGQRALDSLPLANYSGTRRQQLQELRQQLNQRLQMLDQAVCEQVERRAGARLLLSHPGVGPITALATEVFLGDARRFPNAKAVASYVGLIPSEHSSGGKQRNGSLSKQGNPLLRLLWVEAARAAARKDARLKQFYRKKLVQKGLGKAVVATARKLGIRLWIMMRDQIDYTEFCRRAEQRCPHAGMPE